MDLSIRIATSDDLPAMARIIDRAIVDLQRGFLATAEIEASRLFMGIDTQLLRDGTYLCAVSEGWIVGCGGWSWRRTLFGGDASGDLIDPSPLDPQHEPARIRAMYTDPAFARRGVGIAIITAAEGAARAAGFQTVELMSTLAGEPLYRRCGYHAEGARVSYANVPLIPMRKRLIAQDGKPAESSP
jgi:GNAT superfamily N-acetyltransferase